jgi:hypothetical protein
LTGQVNSLSWQCDFWPENRYQSWNICSTRLVWPRVTFSCSQKLKKKHARCLILNHLKTFWEMWWQYWEDFRKMIYIDTSRHRRDTKLYPKVSGMSR